ncbi:PREDICTED: uncharacterized protein LOC105557329, partial [Vollenhovia emeryi]|uniref:uncharacterized protein LOC105557329 n=1 Tax=Vollenhovia emeryi TaxID=411798 RepID=UPI0005F4C7C1
DHCYTTQIVKEQDCYNANNASRSDFIERLIAEVFSRETLWNSVLPYKLRGPSETKSLWTEIDTSLDVNPGTSQVKWKNLRDRFVKEHAIQCTYIASGSGLVKKKSTWPFYESLCFLIPTINYRKTISNIENINPSKMLLLSQTKDISSPVPGTSNITKKGSSTSYQSISVQKSVLNTQLQSKKKGKASRQDSDSSNISEMETTSRDYKRN